MAKENYISLRGQLRKEPKFIEDENGNPVLAIFSIITMRRDIYDRAGQCSPQWDHPLIVTADPETIKLIKKIKVHDILEIKGTFKTQKSKKRSICPHCGAEQIIEEPLQIINPIFVDVLHRFENDTDGTQYLLRCAEVSNIAKVIGRVCTPTEDIFFGETDKGELYSRYQIAVNRKFFIFDSADENDHSDYPIVYSYGDVAKDDYQVLVQNSLIYIDGYIHTMVYDREVICPECGQSHTDRRQRMNLTPYSVEYLRDFKDDVLESTHVDPDKERDIMDEGNSSETR